MKNYEQPVVVTVDNLAEGVYMASGDDQNPTQRVCRFGRTEANRGADICQACSASGGTVSSGSYFQQDYQGCPDNMPEK